MAKDKKSFILYADQISLIEKLTDEEAGRLVKHLFEYVNDRNPVAVDRLTEIAFEPIKQQLKRDLKDWEETKELKSRGGKIGMERRWAEHNKNKQALTEDNLVTKNVTPITVNGNVNENVTVSVTDTVNDKIQNLQLNIDQRKLKFASTLEPFLSKYGKEFLNEFYKYWTEMNKSQTKFRQESERFWDLPKRLGTWEKNNSKFKQVGFSNQPEKKSARDAGMEALQRLMNQPD